MGLEQFRYLPAVLKKWRMILVAIVIAGGLSYFASQQQERTYETETRLLVGSISSRDNRNQNYLTTGEAVARLYVELLTYDVYDRVVKELDLPIDAGDLARLVDTETVEDSPIFYIIVEYTDPEVGADIANAVAKALIEESYSNLSSVDQQQLDSLNSQINDLETQIDILRVQSVNTLEDLNLSIQQQDATLTVEANAIFTTPTRIPTLTPVPTITSTATISPNLQLTESFLSRTTLSEFQLTSDPDNITLLQLTLTAAAATSTPTPTMTMTPTPTLTTTPIDNVTLLSLRYSQLINQLNASQATLAQLTQSAIELSNQSTRIQILEPARPNYRAGGVSSIVFTVVGAALAAVLAVTVVIYYEIVNTVIRSPEEATQFLELPVVGTVADSRIVGRFYEQYIKTGTLTQSSMLESYRNIQTKLLFEQNELITNPYIIITSGIPKAGRTVTSVNLALVMASNNYKVLLIDADVRQPSLYNIFSLDTHRGFVDMIREITDETIKQTTTKEERKQLYQPYIYNTEMPNLKVIPTGLEHQGLVASTIGSENLRATMKTLQETHNYDAIIIDTPPALFTTEAYILTAATGAQVFLLVEHNTTQSREARSIIEQFTFIKNEIKGIIYNKS